MNRTLFFVLLVVLLYSCNPLKRIDKQVIGDMLPCDSIHEYKSLYISKIDAMLSIDEENYESRLTLYYIPDSIIFLSAVNAGFEIVRLGIMPDSTVLINRLDKLVYVLKENDLAYKTPIRFDDLELLVNKYRFCQMLETMYSNNDSVLNYSEQDIRREIRFKGKNLDLTGFEYFHKKTGEYVVGEIQGVGKLRIYSNYIFNDFEIFAEDGIIEDKEMEINLEVNSRKYQKIIL